MADLLQDIRAQIQARIDQLRPAVDELARLEQALSALEDNTQSAPPTPAAAPRKPRQQARKARSPKRAKPPAEREALRARALELISERPGITKPELRQAAGLSGQQAGQLVRRLLTAEAIEEAALPSGSTGYRTRTTRATQEHDDPPTAPGDDIKPTTDPSSQATTTAA